MRRCAAKLLGIGVRVQRLPDQTRPARKLGTRVAHVQVRDVRALAARKLTGNLAGHGIVKQLRLLAQCRRQDSKSHGWAADAQDVVAHHLQRRKSTQTCMGHAVTVPDRVFQRFLQLFGRDDHLQRCVVALVPGDGLLLGLMLTSGQRGKPVRQRAAQGAEKAFDERPVVGRLGGPEVTRTTQRVAQDVQTGRGQVGTGVVQAGLTPAGKLCLRQGLGDKTTAGYQAQARQAELRLGSRHDGRLHRLDHIEAIAFTAQVQRPAKTHRVATLITASNHTRSISTLCLPPKGSRARMTFRRESNLWASNSTTRAAIATPRACCATGGRRRTVRASPSAPACWSRSTAATSRSAALRSTAGRRWARTLPTTPAWRGPTAPGSARWAVGRHR